MERKSTIAGNTPVKNIPENYNTPGCGYWFELEGGLDDGKKMFFSDTSYGEGEPAAVVVFVHGNPECSYTYRKVITEMKRRAKFPFRIIAMDHIGFGLSDQASYEMVCMDHASNLLQLVRFLDLRNITMVIHDWGGPIGIGALIEEPERLANLMLLNSTVFPMPQQGITYENYPISWLGWCMGPKVVPDLFWGSYASYAIFRTPAGAFRILAGMLGYLVMSQINIYPGEEKAARKLFKEQFRTKMNSRSSQRLVLQTPFWAHGNVYEEPVLGERDTAPFYRHIQENISREWGPEGKDIGARAVLGGWDPTSKDEVIEQWVEHLPQLEGHMQIFEDVGHFVEEVKYKEIADAIIGMTDLV